jgi:hypothetical protein
VIMEGLRKLAMECGESCARHSAPWAGNTQEAGHGAQRKIDEDYRGERSHYEGYDRGTAENRPTQAVSWPVGFQTSLRSFGSRYRPRNQ